ncbi:MAG TPA: hypothetical protein VN516_09325, partial [Candidatus Baltobacteraceae bacterium]|nr:hypothetical protein [Candidatus Baltobacteraceae bacterium]
MKKIVFALGIIAGLSLSVLMARADDRQVLNFNPAWKFLKANPADTQLVKFDDSTWMNVSTPHTYNDTDTFDDFALPGL